MDLRIFGSEGMLLLEVEREREELRRDDQQDRSLYPTRGEGDYACDSPPANFIDLILGRTSENHAPGWAAMRPVEQLDAAYRSVLPGAPERVRPALESCDASAHLSVEL